MRLEADYLTNDRTSTLWGILKPTGMKVAVSFAAAFFFGGIGMVLYAYYVSFNHAEGLLPVIIADALCWPVILVGKITYGPSRTYDLDSVLWRKLGWLALFFYYYLIVSVVVALAAFVRMRHRASTPRDPTP